MPVPTHPTSFATMTGPFVAAPDCAKRPPFGMITTTTAPANTAPSNILDDDDEYDADAYFNAPNTNPVVPRPLNPCPWTGAPIRAIVPLPRRRHASKCVPMPPNPVVLRAPAPSVARPNQTTRFRDSDMREDDEDGLSETCCSYESITAAEGLGAWSFEELRVECYAQCLIARGTQQPPPVVQPSLAIPPAFVPRIVPRS